jgi:hypothetical protein
MDNESRYALTRTARLAALSIGVGMLQLTGSFAQEAVSPDIPAPEIEAFAADADPPAFDTPEALAAAFKEALQEPDAGAVAILLGLDPDKLKADESTDEAYSMIRAGAERQLLIGGEEDRRTLLIGEKLWPLPFPIVKQDDGKWAFGTDDGLEEIVNRRVGENELETIATMRAYVDAQEEYASVDRDDDGVEEFAQKLVSSEGSTDGLYWPTDALNGESPAGDLSQSELADAEQGEGYFGYRYKILTGQGDEVVGGAYDYVVNGNMIIGHGLLAWPVRYGETGVKTFAVNQRGVIYETDLGPATDTVVEYIDRFNPNGDWTVVQD